MDCHGVQTREKIVQNYTLNVLSHVKLLPGQIKRSCAKKDLTNEYYLFEAIDHQGKSNQFLAGRGSGGDLIKLENKKRQNQGLTALPIPKLFNPLSTLAIGPGGGGSTGATPINIDPVNKDILKVINLLVCIWDLETKLKVISEITHEVNTNPTQRVKYRYIKAINTLVSRDTIISDPNNQVNNLQDLLEWYRHHPQTLWDFKAFTFTHLKDEINRGINQNWNGITYNYIDV